AANRLLHLPRLGIDLADRSTAITAGIERAVRPRETRDVVVRERDGRDHLAGLRIDLADHFASDLVQMRSVERRPLLRLDVRRAHFFLRARIDGAQSAARAVGEPDVSPVEAHAMDATHALDGDLRNGLRFLRLRGHSLPPTTPLPLGDDAEEQHL